jgi:LysM domain
VKRTAATASLLIATALAPAAARAQPASVPTGQYSPAPGNAPMTIDMHGGQSDPSPPPATPAQPSQPAAPTIITIGPDGRPVAPAAAAPSGFYYSDDTAEPAEQTLQLHAGPTPELHVVRSGDTLWDICFYYFNDPWQWPKVWSYNPQITNPHWIYPGDLVRLVPHGMSVTIAPSPVPTDVESAPGPGPGGDSSLGSEPAPAKSFGVELRQVAFIDQEQLDTPIVIDGSVEPKTLLSSGDTVYLSYPAGKPPKVGARYSVYTIGNTVTHPTTGNKVGAYVHLLGELQVQSVKKDKRATAIITQSDHEIERGAHVGPLQKKLTTVPPARTTLDAQGTIVAMLTQDQLIGTGEVVFVDLGEKSGLQVGNRMYVVRRGDPIDVKARTAVGQDDRRFPAHAIGEIVIVDIGKSVSIGLVTLAVQEMGVGDLVMMQASK